MDNLRSKKQINRWLQCSEMLQRHIKIVMKCLPWIGSHLLLPSLPNRCLLCHQSIDAPHSGVCPVCLSACLYQGAICLGCGRNMSVLQAYCGQCQRTEPLHIIAPCSYHQGMGHWVAAMKYQGQFAAMSALNLALLARLRALEQAGVLRMPQVLVPVPLHPHRLQERGFNQAWVIAEELSRLAHLPLNDNALVRVRHTRPQAGLSGKLRRRNLANAFELAGEFPYQRIALVDDVVTTGTTVQEIAQLFTSRSIHVQVWCLARAEAPELLDSTE